MMTERDVLRLCPDSTLAKMFNGLHELKKVNDEVFVDRDGRTFQHLVNYLRNNRETYPEFVDPNDEVQFMKELDFWKVPTMQTPVRLAVRPTHEKGGKTEKKELPKASYDKPSPARDHPSPTSTGRQPS